jgi:hypothetical protein
MGPGSSDMNLDKSNFLGKIWGKKKRGLAMKSVLPLNELKIRNLKPELKSKK